MGRDQVGVGSGWGGIRLRWDKVEVGSGWAGIKDRTRCTR